MNNPEQITHQDNQMRGDGEEELNGITLPPPHQGVFTYAPQPPSHFWLEIEKRHTEQQEQTRQISQNATNREMGWQAEKERIAKHYKQRWEEAPNDPSRPTPWHYVPTEPLQQDNEQLTSNESNIESGEEKVIIYTETDDERASRIATKLLQEREAPTSSQQRTEKETTNQEHNKKNTHLSVSL